VSIDARSPDPQVLREAADLLSKQGLIAYPTDTLYGLAVDPRSTAAVARLYGAKGRDAGLGIPLIAGSIEQAQEVAVFGPQDLAVARAFWPGPLTLVLRSRGQLADGISVDGRTLAVRVPAHPVARLLADAFAFCVTATSANRSGEPPASTADEAARALSASIDLVLDGGAAPGGPPSTIVEMAAHGPRLVRAGAVAWERVINSLQ
jgi:L-threonylcarbamoyladenylate synthase